MEIRHTPVLLEEVMDLCRVAGTDTVVDATTGEGGHSEAFLKRFPDCRLICLDADASIQAKAKQRLAPWKDRTQFVLTWFDEFFETISQRADLVSVKPNVILMDLGISIFHYGESQRGFSFKSEEPLDMRLNDSEGESAADWVNGRSEEELAQVFFEYGEESFSRKIARGIVQGRKQERIESAKQLADIIWEAVPASYRYGRIHPATKSFQALRIVVNDELGRLKRALQGALKCLAVGGRLAVISFHSLEDRIVKTFFRDQAKECICPETVARCVCTRRPVVKDLTRKPITASDEENARNAPSRSAKLRGVLKLRERRDDL